LELSETKSGSPAESTAWRLSIVELIVLVSAIAFAFRLGEMFRGLGWGYQIGPVWFQVTQRTTFALSIGLPVTAIYRFILNKRISGRFLLQPGHWALFASQLVCLGYIVPVVLLIALSQSSSLAEGERGYDLYLISGTIAYFVAALVMLRGCFFCSRWWKAIFVLVAFDLLTGAVCEVRIYQIQHLGTGPTWLSESSLFNAMLDFNKVLNCILVVALLIVDLKEVKAGLRRGLYHWVGVAAIVLRTPTQLLVNYLFARFVI
jgi:hypothetical protein